MSDGRCSIRLTRRYAATVDEVWDALLAGRWLGTDAVTVRVVEPRRLVELALPESVARIELRVEGETIVLVLDHDGVPAPAGMRAMRVWTVSLERLSEEL
jgi:hypothetical protein